MARRASKPMPKRNGGSAGTRGRIPAAMPFVGTGLSLVSLSFCAPLSPTGGVMVAPTAAFGLSETDAGAVATSAITSAVNVSSKPESSNERVKAGFMAETESFLVPRPISLRYLGHFPLRRPSGDCAAVTGCFRLLRCRRPRHPARARLLSVRRSARCSRSPFRDRRGLRHCRLHPGNRQPEARPAAHS